MCQTWLQVCYLVPDQLYYILDVTLICLPKCLYDNIEAITGEMLLHSIKPQDLIHVFIEYHLLNNTTPHKAQWPLYRSRSCTFIVMVCQVSWSPWLYWTCSGVPNKKTPIAADIIVFGIILCEFLFYIEIGMLCVLIRMASMRRFWWEHTTYYGKPSAQ